MRRTVLIFLAALLGAAACTGTRATPGPAATPTPAAAATAPHPGRAPVVEVVVDRRIELLAIVFRLAEAEEYATRTVPRYAAAIDTFFAAHRGHPVTAEVRRLRRERGISHDAVMSLAVHLGDFPGLGERVPFEGSQLEQRWTPAEARAFLALVQDFARVSDAARFFREQEPLYERAVGRLRTLVQAEVDPAWIPAFFDDTPNARLILAVAPGNGTWAYGPRVHLPDGTRELYAVMSVPRVDEEGMPTFGPGTAANIVHEFSHSFVNPVVERHLARLLPAADAVAAAVAPQMARLGYRETRTVVSESLVRAAVARHALAHQGEDTARHELRRQQVGGFLWIDELYDLLATYERSRDRYPTFESFFPRIVEYYAALPPRLPAMAAAYEARRPRLVGMTPGNGSGRVDPATTQLVFRFDRSMRGSYTVMLGPGGRERYPESPSAGWDSTGTVFTMAVKLKPAWSYEFSLNSPGMAGFLSQEGLPLAPYEVRFTTAPAR